MLCSALLCSAPLYSALLRFTLLRSMFGPFTAAKTSIHGALVFERQSPQYDLGKLRTFSAMKFRISCGLTGARRGIMTSRK